ncbi:MAG: ATP-binding protein [Candidatus Aminicenantales bacterium]|jgi:hypothetical protein
MNNNFASAYPRKNFFIQMFTKDIGLEDCILDLIDNSIDGLIRSRKIKLSDLSKWVFAKDPKPSVHLTGRPVIRVTFSEDSVKVEDNCGGLDLEYARNEAFNFGHGPDWKKGFLGVYGVGLKRALFKLGEEFRIESHTIENGFECSLDVSEWIKQDKSVDDWRIPLKELPKAHSEKSAGTSILVSRLHNEVKMCVKAGSFYKSLYDSIRRTYSFFIGKYVRIYLNQTEIEPYRIPLSRPKGGNVSYEEFEKNGVKVRIIATIAELDDTGRYNQALAGWYVVCNGRIVLLADKSEITGWGIPPMPTYQPKHRCFIGLAFFQAENPLLLPWTTTKTALNKESPIYLTARDRMAIVARPVFSFINKKYPSDLDVEPIERDIARVVESKSVGQLVSNKNTIFSAPPQAQPTPRTTTSVQYSAKISDLEKIRKHLRKPKMGASRIGEYTLAYFLEKEGLK